MFPGAKHLSIDRKRRELYSPHSEGCYDRQQAHDARSKRPTANLFEPGTAFGAITPTDPID